MKKLSLYSRQLAYYNTVPKDKEKTRFELLPNKNVAQLPELIGYGHLITYLKEMNWGSYGGMGEKTPLTFMEIESFMRITNTRLTHWEVLSLRQLSLEYIAQTQKKGEMETPPYMETTEAEYLKLTAVSGNSIANKFGFVIAKNK